MLFDVVTEFIFNGTDNGISEDFRKPEIRSALFNTSDVKFIINESGKFEY